MTAAIDRAEVYRIFSDALDREAKDRDAFVQERCGTRPELQREVLSLLAAAAPGSDSTGVLLGTAEQPVRDLLGREYGQFRLVELIGAGGMGAVYRAQRTDGVPQSVAVKLLRGAVTAASGARFIYEAKLLARLEHPAVARFIDVGVKDGEGWIALELVRGQRIDEYCDLHRLGIRERVRLLIQVAEAVATAHRMLVVHRDIKPTNVLVSGEGQPKLIDFGIALAISDIQETSQTNAELRRSFTPHYAAPEQVRGEPVTVATDVFGLGALAYRVLSGHAPFSKATSSVGYLLAVSSGDVELPSRAAASATPGVRAAMTLKGDLDAILLKALQREPSHRYSSAQDLLADLQRYLDGLPVSAHASSPGYRLAKFVRRRALAVTLGSIIVTGLITSGALYGLQERRVAQARDAAARRGEFLERVLRSADPREGRRDIRVAELLDSAERTIDQSLGKEPLVEASMLGLIVDTNSGLGRYPEGLAASDRQLALLNAHGGTNLDIARALTARGELLRAYGHYAEGLPVLRNAVALLQPLSGVDEDKAVALDELAETLTNRGGEKEAEALFRQAIVLFRRGPEEKRGNMATPMQNLAVLLGNEGRYSESASEAREALAVQRKFLPADHPDLLTAEATYAMALLNMHEPSQAEPLLRDVMTRSARVRGPEHPDTLVAQTQLGEVLIDLGRFTEAEVILQPTAEALDRVHGPDSRYATGTWSDYAVAACSGQHAADGLTAARRIAETRARTLATDDWHLMAAQADIGLCLVSLRRFSEAEPLLTNAAASLEASRGAAFYTTQLTYKALHELYVRTDRAAEAERIATKIER